MPYCRRDDFPTLARKVHGHPLVYLDTAATALTPTPVISAMDHYYQQCGGTVHRAVYTLAQEATEQVEGVREQVRAFIGAAHVDEIVFSRGTTAALNLVASSGGRAFVGPGDEILVAESEHHANIVPWQLMAEERGAILRVIPLLDDGQLDLAAYRALLSPKTRFVAVAHISNVLGTVHPLEILIREAHQVGAKVVVDGAQGVAMRPVDVAALDADFYAFSGHKLYGSTGVGVLFGKREWLEALPPYQGGGDMIDQVSWEGTTFRPPPLKFEAGTPMIAEIIGLGAALKYIASVGYPDRSLLAHVTEQLKQIPGLKIWGEAPDKGAIISFTIEGVHPLDLATLLDLRGIQVRSGHLCAQPTMQRYGVEAMTRVSFGLYTTSSDIESFLTALSTILPTLRSAHNAC